MKKIDITRCDTYTYYQRDISEERYMTQILRDLNEGAGWIVLKEATDIDETFNHGVRDVSFNE
ncbi:hypothetical protein MMC28_010797, partial [Mycoblastus sanguinarius]|nr:hypothetical protein [Mycoblastus sanguinarius]